MNREQKQLLVEQLSERLRQSPTLYLTDFTGLDVAAMTEFRRRLRAAGLEYLVVKNRLVSRALSPTMAEGIGEHLRGPTGVVLAEADPLGAAKIVAQFQKEFQRPSVKVGFLEGRPLPAAQVARLAALPSRPELLAQVGGALQAPMAGLLGALNGLLYNLIGVLESLRAQRAGAES